MTVINESGLYDLIFQSRKPEAKAEKPAPRQEAPRPAEPQKPAIGQIISRPGEAPRPGARPAGQ